MTLRPLGIRAKLNLGLGFVLLTVTATFGAGYAWLERDNALEIEREHLVHMAELARLYVADAGDRRELKGAVIEFNQKLSASRDALHRLIVKDARGMVLVTSDPGSALGAADEGLRVELPFRSDRYAGDSQAGAPAQLVLSESLPRVGEMFRASLIRHLGFGAGVMGIAMLAAGILVHRLVVGPVREIVAATDEIAQDGHWEPITPEGRRRDEIGVLEDHLAQMSRRLSEAVRDERYGSAHLVAERVRRELDEPLRRVAMELTALETLLAVDSDEARARAQIAAEIEEIAEISQRLKALPARPPR